MNELDPAPVTSSARAPRSGLLLCCVLVAVLASYIPVLGAPFVWDDHHLIEESPSVQTLHPLSEYFSHGFWQSDDVEPARSYYRPLSILSLALDNKIYGGNSGGFHLTNLLFHLLSTALLFSVLRARRVPAFAAALGTALWALHPRLTEAVAWISGRTDVLAGFFVLCALAVQRRRDWLGSFGPALFLLLGLFSKEVALAGVAAVCVLELYTPGTRRERAQRLSPTVFALVAYIGFRVHALGVDFARGLSLTLEDRLRACAGSVGHYCVMLVAPWFPDVQIGRLHRPGHAYVYLGSVALIGALVWIARKGRRIRPETASSLALGAVAFLLVLHLIPLPVGVLAADRFLYLPLLGIALLATPWLAGLARGTVVAAVAGGVALSFAATTFVRAGIWSDEVALWTTTFRDAKEDPSIASVELGRLYAKAGLFPYALSIYHAGARPALPGYAMSINNAASVLARTGRYDDAAALLSALLQQFPDTPLFSFNLALFDSYTNHFDLARVQLSHALALYPEYPQGNALVELLPEMERERRTLDALPASAPPLERARLAGKIGLAAESLVAWRTAFAGPTLTQKDFEEGLWFVLREGDSATVAESCREYGVRFPNEQDERLDLVCDTRLDLTRRLSDAWSSLGLETPP